MAWTRLGLTLYIFAILNFCFLILSLVQQFYMFMFISLANYLILVIACSNIEEDGSHMFNDK